MRFIPLSCALALVGCGDNLAGPEGPGPEDITPDQPISRVSQPTMHVTGLTATSVSFEICAGRSGMPSGFGVQWMREESFTRWPGMFDAAVCGAEATGSVENRFAIPAYGCVDYTVGRLFDEEPGVSYSCDDLTCDTVYVFRAYGLAGATMDPSPFSETVYAGTLACYVPPPPPEYDGCTLTQGYWKNHEEAWPVATLALGNVTYDQAQLLAIFRTPAKGNGLVALAHQLTAAKLNVAADADPNEAPIADADALIGNLVVPPIGAGYLEPAVTSPVNDALADYNEGLTGPGHCEAQ